MLDKKQMQEIQDLKLRGYTKSEILAYYKEQGVKPPSRPTISKYYDMDVVPEDPGCKLSKDKAFDVSPFKEAILAILESNSRKDYCISSVYDVFGDNGVIAVTIVHQNKNVLDIELWIMSCRVLKRDMEFAMMDALIEECKKRNIDRVVGHYYPTAKNGMVKDFYSLHGFKKFNEDSEGNADWEILVADYKPKNRVIEVSH